MLLPFYPHQSGIVVLQGPDPVQFSILDVPVRVCAASCGGDWSVCVCGGVFLRYENKCFPYHGVTL